MIKSIDFPPHVISPLSYCYHIQWAVTIQKDWIGHRQKLPINSFWQFLVIE
jgi:hypothetical protein